MAGCLMRWNEEAKQSYMRTGGFGWDPSIFLKSGTKVLQKADGMMVESVKHIDVDKGSLMFLFLFLKPEDRKGLEQRDKMPKMGRKSAGAHGPNQSNKQPRCIPT